MKIEIDIITLGAIALIIIGIIIGAIAYYSYSNQSCIGDPVAYANDHSNNYWWDKVVPINYN